MNDGPRFERVTGVACIVGGVCAIASSVLLAAATNFNPDIFSNSGTLILIGAKGANLLRWGMILDTFGYYLPLAPLALLLWNRYKPSSPQLVTLYTLGGLSYILIGAMGAMVLAAVLPPLVNAYTSAVGGQREILQVVFDSFLNAVYKGLWNPLEALLVGIWWVGIGPLVRRERRMLGLITIVLGVGALLDAMGWILNATPIYIVGLGMMLTLFLIWELWFGVDLLRQPLRIREPVK